MFQTEPKGGYSLKETIQFETKFLKVGELFENGHFKNVQNRIVE